MKGKNPIKSFFHQRETFDVKMKAGLENGHQTAATGDAGVSKEPWIKCRYVAVFMGFLADVLYNAHRITMSIGLVAMVNHTADVSGEGNMKPESCPVSFRNVSNGDFLSSESLEYTSGEFDWSPELQGYVLGISYLFFVACLIPAGWLTELIGCKKVLLWSLMLASVFTCLTPFAARWSVYAVIIVQSLRGAAQAGVFPSECTVVANWCPKSERGFALAFVYSGTCVGSVLGSYISGLLCESTLLGGWPSAFYFFGLLGILVSLFGVFFMYDNPSVHPRMSKAEFQYITSNQENVLTEKRPPTPYRSLFKSVPVYALGFSYFGQFWTVSHFATVHPIFIKTILHYTVAEDGLLSALPFLTQFLTILVACWFSSLLIEKKYISVDTSRKLYNSLSCIGYSGCLLGIYYAECNRSLSVVFGILSFAFGGLAYAGCWVALVDMSPTFAASLDAIVCTVGNLAHFILPLVVGYLTDGKETIEQWNKVLFISLAVVMASGLVFALFGSAKLQPWNDGLQKDQEKTNAKASTKDSQERC